ncbi:MAG: tetraacyldisaccharide 4'-kinase [Sedimentisphaerales bacterium]|nr:tetraacyldisaccharide 4'-kinase [Sedimentisphaerales bacterium]
MNQTAYRMLISGQDRRMRAVLVRALLSCFALVYAAAVRCRNLLYHFGVLRSHAVKVPVISIGNITTGGTGKTPLVIWLCRYLSQKQIRCAVLTRGYKTTAGEMSDEPALLAKSCPGVQVVINPDRVAGAEKAIRDYQPQVLVLDDGFQHRRIQRDLNIVAIDATCPFGYDKLLPAGLLREPLSELKRADAAIITRFDLADAQQASQIEQRIMELAGPIPIARALHRHTHAMLTSGQPLPLDKLRTMKLFIYCGIGNPQAFMHCLQQDGITIVGSCFFNDHHDYTMQDVKSIAAQARHSGADMAVCTQKDWVKTAVFCRQIETISFGAMVMELDFAANAEIIESLIDRVIQR